ncbi:MAG: Ig-like domain-containing protein [Verrucomicrobiota bacterium]
MKWVKSILILGVLIFHADFASTVLAWDRYAQPMAYFKAPENGAVVSAGKPLTLKVGAQSRNSIHRVDFYINGKLVHRDYKRPYQFTWKSVPAGKHELRCQASTIFHVRRSSPKVRITAR